MSNQVAYVRQTYIGPNFCGGRCYSGEHIGYICDRTSLMLRTPARRHLQQ